MNVVTWKRAADLAPGDVIDCPWSPPSNGYPRWNGYPRCAGISVDVDPNTTDDPERWTIPFVKVAFRFIGGDHPRYRFVGKDTVSTSSMHAECAVIVYLDRDPAQTTAPRRRGRTTP